MCLAVLPFPGATQDFNYGYYISEEDGLPTSSITSMAEDSFGFMWIGTTRGLARYDGSQFKIYTHDPEKANSLANVQVFHLISDKEHLWIATSVGLSRLEYASDTFRNYSFPAPEWHSHSVRPASDNVRAMTRSSNGDIWVGLRSYGIGRYDASRDTFAYVTPEFDRTVDEDVPGWTINNILDIAQDMYHDHIMWVGTLVGLYRLDTRTNKARVYHVPFENKDYEVSYNSFRFIQQLDTNNLCWGSWHTGVHIIDTRTGETSRLPGTEDYPQLAEGVVNSLRLTADSILWISSETLVKYDWGNKKVLQEYHSNFAEKLIYRDNFRDSEGRIYGFTYHGICVFDPILQQFQSHSLDNYVPEKIGMIFSITNDSPRNQYLVCVRGEGLFKFNKTTRNWDMVNIPSFLPEPWWPNSSFQSKSMGPDMYWLTHSNQILTYDARTDVIGPVVAEVPLEVSYIQEILEDSRGRVWIGSSREGVFELDRSTGQVQRTVFKGRVAGAAGETGVFMEDSRGNIWKKMRRGYSVYEPASDSVYVFEPKGFFAPVSRTFAESKDGHVWIANRYGKLYRTSADAPGKGIIDTFHFAKESGPLYAIDVAPDGNLWCTREDVLTKFDPLTRQIVDFRYIYGTPPRSSFCFEILSDGMMTFGMRDEMIIADPATLRSNQTPAIPYITGIAVREQPINHPHISDPEPTLSLGPADNFFSISFSSISHTGGANTQYRHRLVGFQDEWTTSDLSRTAVYTNVPSGDYFFELAAANNEGVWNPDVYRMPVSIGYYWHTTTFARTIGVLLFLGLVYGIYRYRILQIRKEERLRTKFQRQLADVEMSALRAQMNPHFIFNCLNSIESFVIKNETLKASTYLNDFARLIRLILQNSRSSLVSIEDELEALELYLQMESLRFSNKFQYKVHVDSNLDSANLEIPPMLIQPYVENAIWHGLMPKDGAGHLNIDLSRQNGMIRCIIEDDGIGRDKSKEIRASRRVKGKKSMGMSITGDRIKLLNILHNTNTEVNIEDLKDPDGKPSGTRVELHIPV